MVNVTIKAAMRHGDLHKAATKAGSLVALAAIIQVSYSELGTWYRYEACPPEKPTKSWSQARLDALEASLFELTGKLLEDLFPPAVRDRAFQKMKKNAETNKDIEESRLLEMAHSVRAIEYHQPNELEKEELANAISTVIGDLSYREAEVIKMRYGIACDQTYTYEEIGHVMKVTRERIRQIEDKALRKLQTTDFKKKLKGHLENE